MKRLIFILCAVAISGGALIGQSQRASKSNADAPQKPQSGVTHSSSELSHSDYRAELRNERREARQQRRAQRIAEYTRYIDSLVLSRNFQFNPQTMQQQPAGPMQIISNPNFDLALWDTTVDICLPYIKGYTPPYYYTVLNYTIPDVADLVLEQTAHGWNISFNSSLYSASTYTFSLEIISANGGGTLTISSPWYNSVQYSGTLTALY